jgi:hypothetical protein
MNDQAPEHVHAWQPWDAARPTLVHCTDNACALFAATVELTDRGTFLRSAPTVPALPDDWAAIPEGLFRAAIGPPPWQILVQVKAADSTIRATYHGPTLLDMDDVARIEFRLRDWQPLSGTGGTQIAEPPVNARRIVRPPAALSGPSGGTVGSAGLAHDVAMAAAEDNTTEALAALAAVASAAGVHAATMGARSITEVGEIIAARVTELRRG